MRAAALSALILATSMATAQAETWRSREGECGEWRAQWNVEQQQDGTWTGEVDHRYVGGACVQGNGKVFRSTVRAVIVGENFFAVRQLPETTAVCSYYGQIEQDRVRGLELCEGVPKRLAFALRFPEGGGTREARQRPESRPEDEFLDDPKNSRPGARRPRPELRATEVM